MVPSPLRSPSRSLRSPDDATDRSPHESVREAVRYGTVAAGIAGVFMVLSTLWLSTCVGDTADAVACGAPQRTLLTLAAPGALLAAGMWALARPHHTETPREHARAWQGAGLVLLTLMVVTLAVSLRHLPGLGQL
ncbi:putative transmembrane protein [Mycolicibacterium smegmatis]|uniref:Transmembrane protein n=1 Tax=Mycolicibacterium smegmatis (strain MKD8) TaxID=1214915 RepID=A0A2U9PM11_MYCSE|nr:hypothetical protein D806_017620 [Mycolicibacterium smegmatis MKD8]CKH33715.1 putative transmembrane protein [Mycolicibacterium smegmatis]